MVAEQCAGAGRIVCIHDGQKKGDAAAAEAVVVAKVMLIGFNVTISNTTTQAYMNTYVYACIMFRND